MNKTVLDGRKPEAKPFLWAMLIGFALAIIMPLATLISKDGSNELAIPLSITYLIIGAYGLYGWLYAISYKLTVTEEKVALKTLFAKKELDMGSITGFSCKKHKQTELYNFRLYQGKAHITVRTRFKDDLEALLHSRNIEQKAK